MAPSPTHAPAPRLLHVLAAFFAVYVIWGSTYLGIKFAIQTIPPFMMAGARFAVAGAALYAWSRSRGAPAPTRRQWRDACIVGGLLLFISNGGVVWSEQRVPSGLTSLLVASVPLWMVLLDWLRKGGTRPDHRVFIGLFLGMLGIFLLVGPREFAGAARVDPLGAIVLISVSFIWSIGSLYSRTAAKPAAPLLAASMQMLAAGLMHLTTSAAIGEWYGFSVSAVSRESFAAWGYLVVLGSLIGFTAYMWLLRVCSPARVATYAYVNPIVAVFFGWTLGHEPLAPRTLYAAAIIIAAVVFITTAQTSRATAPALPVQPPHPNMERKRHAHGTLQPEPLDSRLKLPSPNQQPLESPTSRA